MAIALDSSSLHIPEILSPAIFIADAHYIPEPNHTFTLDFSKLESSQNTRVESPLESKWEFLDSSSPYPCYIGKNGFIGLLQSLLLNPPTQLFLMGDIAHLFIPHITHNAVIHREFITLLNALSHRMEVFYFEGNHDFGLDSRLLPRVKIYPRKLQPAVFTYQNKLFLLSHGDCFITKGYEYYITALSAPFTLSVLKLIDTISLGYIHSCARSLVNAKHIKSLALNEYDFRDFASKRIAAYKHYTYCNAHDLPTLQNQVHKPYKQTPEKCDFGVIEGHFHIGKKWQNFFALPSFYCEKRILVL
ncbi:hypothetical protein [Helicobacter sp.]|uniref:hypothetical protein n=1 Tax=Helicobacter sp. TaxID=218 RepID=UPI0025C436F4|nr:hypothetical protein [Helicobacter sp.]MBR2495430.1 hypothetical protein [Helicobacter sp.]